MIASLPVVTINPTWVGVHQGRPRLSARLVAAKQQRTNNEVFPPTVVDQKVSLSRDLLA